MMRDKGKAARRWIVLTTMVFMFTVSAFGADTTKVDLEQAIALALEHDAGFQVAKFDVDIAAINLERAEAGNLMQPSPSLLYQAQVGLELAERSLLMAERTLMLDVEQDYYTLLRLENVLHVLDEAIRLAQRQYEVAEKRYANGAATALDVMKAETALARHMADQQQAEAGLHLARAKFKQTLGLPLTVDVVLHADVITEQLPDIDLAKALHEGAAQRLELAQARAGVAIAEKELQLATNDYTPVLERRLAEQQLARANYQLQQAEQGIRLDIENTFNAMHDAHRRLHLAQLELKEMEENYRVVAALFDVGMATDVELLQVQTGMMQARTADVQAIYDFNIARASLFHAMGRSIRDRM